MVVGRPCAALYKGGWICGKIVKHHVKLNKCIVETREYGSIVVSDHRIRLTDKPE